MLAIHDLVIVSTVLFCSVCQSIIGVGLIMIGLPTLVLCGFAFEYALTICLPGSMLINTFQVINQRESYTRNDVDSYIVMAVLYMVSLVVLNHYLGIGFSKLLAGSILLTTGLVGFNKNIRERFLGFVRDNSTKASLGIGVIHAISSLGGSLLSLTGSAKYQKGGDARRFIAGGYLTLEMIQLGYYIIKGVDFSHVGFSVLAAPIYYLSYRFITPYVSDGWLRNFIFGVISLYGILLLIQSTR
ncbi:hypothetical protein [Providencia sp. PROV255]|uniref:hypothetical protein n=1 Tax=Providencia sp. PROV255 TaxID=2949943 RepID=UPI00234A7A1A|nr:hypothetical protein [Providencia sp. PROV255]